MKRRLDSSFLFILLLLMLFISRVTCLSCTFTTSCQRLLLKGKRNVSGRQAFQRTVPTMMPEGPEVKTLVKQLQPGVGQRLVNLRFVSGRYTNHGKPRGYDSFRKTMTSYVADDTKNIDVVQSWNCKGKFIWLSLDQGKKKDGIDIHDEDHYRSIWITLGMSGRFVRDTFNMEEEDDGTTHKQPRWYFEFLDEGPHNPENLTKKIYYYDTRNFGTLRFSTSKRELMEKLDSLGPDILEDCTEELFMKLIRDKRQSMNICKFLMNQSILAGVGNYLLSEALYRSNLDPFASLEEFTDDQTKLLYKEVVDTARASYDAQGMTRSAGGSYRDVDGNEGKFTFSLQCYGREFCPEGREVIREINGPHKRTIWYVEDQLFMPRSKREDGVRSISTVSTRSAEVDDDNVPKKRNMASGEDTTDINSLKENTVNGLSLYEHVPSSWKGVLAPFLGSEKFDRLSRFVESERRLHTIYPPAEDVFSAFKFCSFDDVKVVIIGQDPYHGPDQGHGLAFSVQRGIRMPPSLKNIFKELVDDEGIEYPEHGNLESWAKQGVLLLNTVLTVRRGEANSHAKMGWEDFTDEVVEALNEKSGGLVFLLWGGPAAKIGRAVDRSKHTVITTSHPSPLGATKTASPFLGSRCFSRCNDALRSKGKEPIDWNV